ncbi:hypothetical protein FSP39_002421 [Pinctada imbricata]|uniref:Flavin-containing monooxygenase n=1 Tax=Pinctada imbricata TaxID=66713 RepID=A0AA88XJZ1_PINIB|nr:hypothetical protein FSP39_002421 [Pinctada imbricata]
MVKKVAVIGAGASGLPAIKCCLDEGLEPVCFERTDHIGGLWYYTKSAIDGQACVMKSTVINTSKEMMCYSDFPIPKEYPNYMHNTYVLKYFNLYADHFGLRKYIQFRKERVHVHYLHVGMDKFKGTVTHSHDYKDFHVYEDKRLVVVGIGNSGGDAAVELCRVASQVFLSTRRGSWIINRVGDNGYPADLNRGARYMRAMFQVLPSWVPNKMRERQVNRRFDHAMYSMKPKHAPMSQHPTVNDDLPNRIICGSIIVKPNIKTFTETSVVFEDGTKEDVDAVIFATGYIFGFPFLDKSVTEVKDNKVNLYKYMFPPDLERNTLCIIGCIQPLGAIMPISENQSRLFTRVVKGTVTLPSSSEMWNDIHLKSNIMAKQYVKSYRHTIQVSYIQFMDEIAEIAGHKPNLHALFLRDPKLAMKCFLQGCTPYQYRLMGPNSWKGARDAIMTQMDRVHYPLKTRPLGFDEEKSKDNFFLYLVLGIGIAYIVYYYMFISFWTEE